MDTIEAIAWIRNLTAFFNYPASYNIQKNSDALKNSEKADEIVGLLQRGEKYEAMFSEFEYKILNMNFGNKYYPFKEKLEEMKNELKQKYFPEDNSELSKTIDRIIQIINETSFTCKEIAKRLIPKD